MIGVRKNIIAVAAGPFQFAMINPVITKKLRPYQTEEGCLSLEGVRPCRDTKRLKWITWIAISGNSMANTPAGQPRSSSMK